MELHGETRGLIEKIIDNVLLYADKIIKLYFNPESKKQLHIQNESDFVLGFASGIMHAWCLSSFLSMHARFPNDHEQSEVAALINRRMVEVRNAVTLLPIPLLHTPVSRSR
jgi:hypothetical protein